MGERDSNGLGAVRGLAHSCGYRRDLPLACIEVRAAGNGSTFGRGVERPILRQPQAGRHNAYAASRRPARALARAARARADPRRWAIHSGDGQAPDGL